MGDSARNFKIEVTHFCGTTERSIRKETLVKDERERQSEDTSKEKNSHCRSKSRPW